MIMKRIFLFVSLLVTGIAAMANGDPVSYRSALALSRTPVAVHVPQVQLLDEQCRFTLGYGYTDVEVRYLLWNRSDSSFHALPYGFPIDWYGEGKARWESADLFSEKISEVGWRDSYVRDVLFSLNGRSLAVRHSGDTVLVPSVAYADPTWILEIGFDGVEYDFDDPLLQPDSADWNYSAKRTRQIVERFGEKILCHTKALCRRWYYAELDLPAGQTVELVVRYKVENNVTSSLYKSYSVFSKGLWQGNRFFYDFSPAAYWGDGKASRFRAVVDTSAAVRRPKYDFFELEGLPMTRTAKGFEYQAYAFDLAKAEPLKINYATICPGEDVAGLLGSRISPDRYSVRLSGGVAKYPAGNLSDMDLSTAAVLRPDANGDLTITITFKDTTLVTGVLIYNGYTKDPVTWRNNSRIDSLDFALDGCWKDCGTENGYFIPYVDWYCNGNEMPADFSWQGLTDAAIRIPITERNMDYVFPWGYVDRRGRIKELTLKVQRTTKGAKYDDLCISEIILLQ